MMELKVKALRRVVKCEKKARSLKKGLVAECIREIKKEAGERGEKVEKEEKRDTTKYRSG